MMCHCMCCVFRCATTASPRRIFKAGMPMRHHVGVTTGGATGNSVEADGISGTAVPRPRHAPHRYRPTSAGLPVTATLACRKNNIRSNPKSIAISRVNPSRNGIINSKAARPDRKAGSGKTSIKSSYMENVSQFSTKSIGLGSRLRANDAGLVIYLLNHARTG